MNTALQEVHDFRIRLRLDDDPESQEMNLSSFLNANMSFLTDDEIARLSQLRPGRSLHGGDHSGWDWTIERV